MTRSVPAAPTLESLAALQPRTLIGTLYGQQLCASGRTAVRRSRTAWAIHVRACPRCVVGARNAALSRSAGPRRR